MISIDFKKYYLDRLKYELRFLKKQDAEEIIKHYRDIFDAKLDAGIAEKEIYDNLPKPEKVYNNYCREKKFDPQVHGKGKKNLFAVLLISLSFFLLSILVIISFFFINEIKTILSLLFNISIKDFLSSIFLLLYAFFYLFLYLVFLEILLLLGRKTLNKSNEIFGKPKNIENYEKFSVFTVFKKLKISPKKLEIFLYIFVFLLIGIYILGAINENTYINDSRKNEKRREISERIEEDFNVVQILSKEINLVLIESLEDKYEYEYSFNNDLEVTVEEGVLRVKLKETRLKDFLRLVSEPDVRLSLYLKNERAIKIEAEKITVSASNQDFRDIIVLSHTAYINLEKINADNFTFKGVKLEGEFIDSWISLNELDCAFGNLKIEGSFFNDFKGKIGSLKFFAKESGILNLDVLGDNASFEVRKIENNNFNLAGNGIKALLYDLESKNVNLSFNGEIGIYNLLAEEIMINSHGQTILENINAKKFEINKENGVLAIYNSKISEFICTVGNLSLILENIEVDRASVEKSEGSISFNNVYAKDKFYLNSNNSDGEFNNFYGNEIEIKIVSGNINYVNIDCEITILIINWGMAAIEKFSVSALEYIEN